MSESSDQVVARIDKAQADVADQLRRADTKAATLLPLFGGFLAGVVALTTRSLPTAAEVVLWLAAAPMALSVLLLLSAVRPRISKGASTPPDVPDPNATSQTIAFTTTSATTTRIASEPSSNA